MRTYKMPIRDLLKQTVKIEVDPNVNNWTEEFDTQGATSLIHLERLVDGEADLSPPCYRFLEVWGNGSLLGEKWHLSSILGEKLAGEIMQSIRDNEEGATFISQEGSEDFEEVQR